MKKVACDIDDVIVDFVNPLLKFCNDKRDTKYQMKDIHSCNFWEIFGSTREDTIKLFDEFYSSSSFARLPLIKGAYQGIFELSRKYDLFLITARPLHIKQITLDYFNAKFSDIPLDINHSSDFFNGNGGSSKCKFCLENDVSFIFEDNSEYALDCAEEGIKVVLFDRPWNRKLQHSNVFRVDGWERALEVVGNEN